MAFTDDNSNQRSSRPQYALPFPEVDGASVSSTFRFSAANERARQLLDIWAETIQEELGQGIIISGPEASGKSHLTKWMAYRLDALVFSATELEHFLAEPADAQVVILDDVERSEPELLMRFIDVCRSSKTSFILCGQGKLQSWTIRQNGEELRDLMTRLASMPEAPLDSPDEELMARVLIDWYEAKQLKLSEELAQNAVKGLKRSFASLAILAEQLDAEALQRQKSIDKTLIQAVKANLPDHILS